LPILSNIFGGEREKVHRKTVRDFLKRWGFQRLEKPTQKGGVEHSIGGFFVRGQQRS